MSTTAHTLAMPDDSATPSLAMTAIGASPQSQAGALTVADLPRDAVATVSALRPPSDAADLALIQRLVEIGFVPGEKLRIIALGHPGHEPIAVRIGSATFALRRFEAQCILVVTAE